MNQDLIPVSLSDLDSNLVASFFTQFEKCVVDY